MLSKMHIFLLVPEDLEKFEAFVNSKYIMSLIKNEHSMTFKMVL